MLYYLNNYQNSHIVPIEDTSIDDFFSDELLMNPIKSENRDNEVFLFNFFQLVDNPEMVEFNEKEYIWKLGKNIKCLECIVLDYDSGEFTIDMAKSFFSRYKYFAHTSYNHKWDKKKNEKTNTEKFRIVLPLERPVQASFIRANRNKILENYPGIDLTSLSTARFFYPPCVHPDRESEYIAWRNDGDLYRIPGKYPVVDKVKYKSIKLVKSKNFILEKIRDYQLKQKTFSATTELEKINFNCRGNGEVHNELLRINARLRHEGLDKDEIMDIMLPYAIDRSSGDEIRHIVEDFRF